MPGIFGYYSVGSYVAPTGLAERMLAALNSDACQLADAHVQEEARFALGRASLGIVSTAPQPAVSTDGHRLAVLDGELYATDRIAGDWERNGSAATSDDQAAILLAAWASGGPRAVATIEGSFAAAIIDTVERSVTLISDRFGTRPLYYSHSDRRFCFASRMSAILADVAVSRDFDICGISQFFTFGHYFGDSTSLAAVKLLPAAAVLVLDARQNKLSIQRYWVGAERIGKQPTSRQSAMDALDEALVASVRKRQLTTGASVGLSLSGGLDARTILGTLDHSRTKVTTVCLGMRGSQDHQASTELARLVGCPHVNHVLDTQFLSSFGNHLENMVRLTDGQYLSQCIVMPTLPLYRELGVGVLLRGHAGELMHMSKAYNYSLDDEALRLKTDDALEAWLWRRLQAYLQDGVDKPLFASPQYGAEAARESLRSALSETPHTETPPNRIAHLFLDQRVRRETMLSLMKFRSVVEPRLPYLDRLLVERLLAIPAEWKLGDEIQTYILRKRQPLFCWVQNTNTGAGLGAGKISRKFARLRMKVLGKLGVPGYQPYERLGLWLRRDLAELVRATLLSDACLERGLFNPDTVRDVVQRHLSGARNHTYLILALMVFEVGHRWLLECGQPCHNDDAAKNSRPLIAGAQADSYR
jgi:asparagine synthase (glutamine-hydrolysing)